jgi:hypothetical protein
MYGWLTHQTRLVIHKKRWCWIWRGTETGGKKLYMRTSPKMAIVTHDRRACLLQLGASQSIFLRSKLRWVGLEILVYDAFLSVLLPNETYISCGNFITKNIFSDRSHFPLCLLNYPSDFLCARHRGQGHSCKVDVSLSTSMFLFIRRNQVHPFFDSHSIFNLPLWVALQRCGVYVYLVPFWSGVCWFGGSIVLEMYETTGFSDFFSLSFLT